MESQAARLAVSWSRVRSSQAWRTATIAMAESADPRRAVNSETPKSLKKTAVIQYVRGGLSIQTKEFQWGTSQPDWSISRETWA